jgi:hypothetical protein
MQQSFPPELVAHLFAMLTEEMAACEAATPIEWADNVRACVAFITRHVKLCSSRTDAHTRADTMHELDRVYADMRASSHATPLLFRAPVLEALAFYRECMSVVLTRLIVSQSRAHA